MACILKICMRAFYSGGDHNTSTPIAQGSEKCDSALREGKEDEMWHLAPNGQCITMNVHSDTFGLFGGQFSIEPRVSEGLKRRRL